MRNILLMRWLVMAGFCFGLLRDLNAADPTAKRLPIDPWVDLASPEYAVREAARQKIEKQPIEQWLDRALLEHRPWATLEIIRSVCEKLPADRKNKVRPHLCEQLMTLPLEQMTDAQIAEATKITKLIFTRLGPASVDERKQMIDLWSAIAASMEKKQRKEVVKETLALLVFLRNPEK